MMLGMKKGRISRMFAGETMCVGFIALITGLIFGFVLSQGLSLVALKLFAIELSKFQLVFSVNAFYKTAICFVVIFSIVMLFNVWSVSSVQLIDLLTANRKNEEFRKYKTDTSSDTIWCFASMYCNRWSLVLQKWYFADTRK